MSIQFVTIQANELFEAWATLQSSHWAEMCEMSVKSDRGNRPTLGDCAPGPEISLRQICRAVREMCRYKLLGVCVCVRVRMCVCKWLAEDGRCQTSQICPRFRTTCWIGAIWRADRHPARVWPSMLTNDTWSHHMTGNVLYVEWPAHPSVFASTSFF